MVKSGPLLVLKLDDWNSSSLSSTTIPESRGRNFFCSFSIDSVRCLLVGLGCSSANAKSDEGHPGLLKKSSSSSMSSRDGEEYPAKLWRARGFEDGGDESLGVMTPSRHGEIQVLHLACEREDVDRTDVASDVVQRLPAFSWRYYPVPCALSLQFFRIEALLEGDVESSEVRESVCNVAHRDRVIRVNV